MQTKYKKEMFSHKTNFLRKDFKLNVKSSKKGKKICGMEEKNEKENLSKKKKYGKKEKSKFLAAH